MIGDASQLSFTVGVVNINSSLQPMVASAPWPESTGGTVSACVMVWLTVALVLPEQSVDVHVLVMVVSPHVSVVEVSTCVTVGELSQLSVAVGAVNTNPSLQPMVASAPWP